MGWYFSRDSFFNMLDSSSEKDKNNLQYDLRKSDDSGNNSIMVNVKT